MPELPEVETVRRGLSAEIQPGTVVEDIIFNRPNLRGPLPFAGIKTAVGQPLSKIERRAKYLLLFLESQLLISHLGMTGSWRLKAESRKHDHVELKLSDGRTFVYRDPRRFGQFDIVSAKTWKEDRRFCALGPEPLDPEAFHAAYLLKVCADRKTPIKALIMDQRIVVGVGNIYASESLFWAGIHPLMPAGQLTTAQAHRLVFTIRDVLLDAIEAGGTTISDFRQAGGSEGYFQNQLFVYGSAGEPCSACDDLIASTVLAGRATYWCPKCQVLS